jgi:hypothetical protein
VTVQCGSKVNTVTKVTGLASGGLSSLVAKRNLAQNLYSMTVFLSFFVQNSAISTDALLEMTETK